MRAADLATPPGRAMLDTNVLLAATDEGPAAMRRPRPGMTATRRTRSLGLPPNSSHARSTRISRVATSISQAWLSVVTASLRLRDHATDSEAGPYGSILSIRIQR